MTRIITLGYAGLIPFVVLPLLYIQPLWLSADQIIDLYYLYSTVILGFMAGVLWPVLHDKSLTPDKCEVLALTAVLFPIFSFCALLFEREYFLLCQAVLFVLLRLCEYRLNIDRRYSSQYRNLRNQLTLIVLLSHLGFNLLVHY